MNTAMWRLDATDKLTAQARATAQRILDRMGTLPDDTPDDVKVRYFRTFLRAGARMRRRAEQSTRRP